MPALADSDRECDERRLAGLDQEYVIAFQSLRNKIEEHDSVLSRLESLIGELQSGTRAPSEVGSSIPPDPLRQSMSEMLQAPGKASESLWSEVVALRQKVEAQSVAPVPSPEYVTHLQFTSFCHEVYGKIDKISFELASSRLQNEQLHMTPRSALVKQAPQHDQLRVNGSTTPRSVHSNPVRAPHLVNLDSAHQGDQNVATQSYEFVVKIDCSDGGNLGMTMGRREDELVVTSIQDGLVKAWNESRPREAVQQGDQIVAVNAQRGSPDVLMRELQKDTVLIFKIRRFGSAPGDLPMAGSRGFPVYM